MSRPTAAVGGVVVVRWLLGLLALVAAVRGLLLLLGLGLPNLVSTAKWAVGGIVLHDFVLVPVTLLLGLLLVRRPRRRLPAPLLAAGVVIGAVTVLAVPVLGRFGARPDNPTLLDRAYWPGWVGLVLVVLVVAGVATLLGRRRAEPGASGASGASGEPEAPGTTETPET